MEIILLKDIDKVGEKHAVVKVKNGYGRNYLIPKGVAVIANKRNMEWLGELKSKEEADLAKRLGEFQAIATKLADITLKIAAKSGTSGKIFGSVTSVQISQALKDQQGVEVDRRKIEIMEEVKELGNYTAKLMLHPEVEPEVKFEVYSD